jgi:hypothetical protein
MPETRPGRTGLRPRFVAPLLLTGAALVFFAPVLLGRRFMWLDAIEIYYPYTLYLSSVLRQLTTPFWNPYIFAGMPFSAEVQSQTFYPLNWLLAFIVPPEPGLFFWFLELKAIAHLVLAGWLMYRLLRELELEPAPALLGGLVYMLGAFPITHVVFLTWTSAYAWLPLLLLLLHRIRKRHRLSDAVWGGLVLGLIHLSGHPQMTTHILLVAVLFAGGEYLAARRQGERGLLRPALLLNGLLLLIGFGIGAVVLIPGYEHSLLTSRTGLPYRDAVLGSLLPTFPITLLVPKFFGSISGTASAPLAPFGVTEVTDTVRFWKGEQFEYLETSFYVGILPLALAAFGAFSSRRPLRILFIVLAVAGLVLALGKYTPVYRLLHAAVPGFDRFRIPSRFGTLFTFGSAGLAALGLQVFLSRDAPPVSRRGLRFGLLVLLVLALLSILFVAWLGPTGLGARLKELPIRANALRQIALAAAFIALTAGYAWFRERRFPRALPLIALLMAFVDLTVFGFAFNQGRISARDYYPKNEAVTELRKRRALHPFRVSGRTGHFMLFKRNEGMVHGLEQTEGFSPLYLSDILPYSIPPHRRFDLLNVEYRTERDTATGDLSLRHFPATRPRVWFVSDYRVVPDRDRIVEMLSRDSFDYCRSVILETEPAPEHRPPPAAPAELPPERVRITAQVQDRLDVEIEADWPGFLVVSEVYYPKWRASVDGRAVPIFRANYGLRAVPVPAGRHEVRFRYDARSTVFSGLVSLLSLVVALGLLALGRSPDRSGGPPET